jgi:hypothetical protein
LTCLEKYLENTVKNLDNIFEKKHKATSDPSPAQLVVKLRIM